MRRIHLLPLASALLLTACATLPTGPSVMVLPGSGKTFEEFQADDAVCRQWAERQVGATPGQVSQESTVGGAALGTAIGAAAGAALGAASGNAGSGAAVGAGIGLLGGTAIGAGNAQDLGNSAQRRYDTTYLQCMYAKGDQIPVASGSLPAYTSAPPRPRVPSLPPGIPPPPPGMPPPPPPGAAE